MSGADEAGASQPRVGTYLSGLSGDEIPSAETRSAAGGLAGDEAPSPDATAVNAETQLIPMIDAGPAAAQLSPAGNRPATLASAAGTVEPRIDRTGSDGTKTDGPKVRAVARRPATALPALGPDGPRDAPASTKSTVDRRRQAQGRDTAEARPAGAPAAEERPAASPASALLGQPEPSVSRHAAESGSTIPAFPPVPEPPAVDLPPSMVLPAPRRPDDNASTVADAVPVSSALEEPTVAAPIVTPAVPAFTATAPTVPGPGVAGPTIATPAVPAPSGTAPTVTGSARVAASASTAASARIVGSASTAATARIVGSATTAATATPAAAGSAAPVVPDLSERSAAPGQPAESGQPAEALQPVESEQPVELADDSAAVPGASNDGTETFEAVPVDPVRPGPPLLTADSWDLPPDGDLGNVVYQGRRRATVPWARVLLIVALLVAVAAIFVIPMILDGPSEPASGDSAKPLVLPAEVTVDVGATGETGELVSAVASAGSRRSSPATKPAAAASAAGLPSAVPTSSPPSPTTTPPAAPLAAFAPIIMQAESAAVSASSWQVDNKSSCDIGSPVVRTGKWSEYSSKPGTVTFTTSVAAAGSYQMTIFGVVSSGTGKRRAEIFVNGASISSPEFTDGCPTTRTITINLGQGSNKILFTNQNSRGPSIDRIEIRKA